MTDHYSNEHEGAVSWLRQSIAKAGPDDSHVRKAYALLALSLRQLGRSQESRKAIEEGLLRTPGDPELHFHFAHLLTETKQYAEAEQHYRQVLAADIGAHFSSVDVGILGYKTFHNLGGLAVLQSDYPKARQWFLQAIQNAPQFLPSVFALFDAALAAGDYAVAQQMIGHVQEQEGLSPTWAELSVRYAETIGGEENGGRFLEQAIQQYPNAITPRLLLARRLLQVERIREAVPHLQLLDAQGVSEAAYCLGVSAIRVGDLEGALKHMERALLLNPEHEQTREQAAYLRQALGIPRGNEPINEKEANAQDNGGTTPVSSQAVPLATALEQLARHFGLEASTLQAYAEEDTIGGYTRVSQNAQSMHWPGGSVWEGEGQALYALVRALKPQTIVEVGSLVGCSTSHLALACLHNGSGTVYAVDPAADFSCVDKELLPYIVAVREDVFTWTPPDNIGFVFEDGAHTKGFTQRALERLKPHLQTEAAVLCHDACHKEYRAHILPELRAILGEQAEAILISPSDCGLGYARYEAVPETPSL